MAKRRSAQDGIGASEYTARRSAPPPQRLTPAAPRAAEAGFGVAMSMAWREADVRRAQARKGKG